MSTRPVYLVASVVCLLAVEARATIIVERYFPAGPPPAGVVGAYYPVQPPALYNFGQSLTIGTTGQLRQVDVLLSRLFPGPASFAPFHMTLTAGIGGAVLADKDFTVPDVLGLGLAWVPVDLVAESIILASGSPLFLTLTSNDAVNTGVAWFGITGPAPLLYQGGAGYQRVLCTPGAPANSGCDTWQPVDNAGQPVDFSFRTYVDDAVALPGVPEPDSWAMLIAGFGLVGAVKRHRRSARTS